MRKAVNLGVWQRRVVLTVLGAVAALGLAPTNLFFLTPLALGIALTIGPATPGVRAAFGAGFWLGVGYFAVALRWIVSPFLVDVATHGWMAPFAIVLMAAGAALFWGAARSFSHRFAPGNMFAAALALAMVEVLRSLILTGFPWAALGQIWVATSLAQLAAWGGPHGLTLLTVALAWSVHMLILRDWLGAVLPVVAGVAAFVVAPPVLAPATDRAPMVRLIQPNVPQSEKWDAATTARHFDDMLRMTSAPVAQGQDAPDLVVLPETALATLIEYAAPMFDELADAAQNATIVTGLQRRDGGRYYNSLVVLAPGAQVAAVYDKQHLVPFGEYIPFGEWAAHLGLQGLAASQGGGFSAGRAGAGVVGLPGIGPARALICYEGIFAEEIAVPGPRPRLLLLITNDAWFGTSAGPQQHLAQAQLRAIEQGLPMVRVANTGISAMIDPYGRIVASLPLGIQGHLDVALPDAIAAPAYTRWGDWPVILLILATFASCAVTARKIRVDGSPQRP